MIKLCRPGLCSGVATAFLDPAVVGGVRAKRFTHLSVVSSAPTSNIARRPGNQLPLPGSVFPRRLPTSFVACPSVCRLVLFERGSSRIPFYGPFDLTSIMACEFVIFLTIVSVVWSSAVFAHPDPQKDVVIRQECNERCNLQVKIYAPFFFFFLRLRPRGRKPLAHYALLRTLEI